MFLRGPGFGDNVWIQRIQGRQHRQSGEEDCGCSHVSQLDGSSFFQLHLVHGSFRCLQPIVARCCALSKVSVKVIAAREISLWSR